jgi:tetratricopeptide (TPR) repeat protein
MKSMFIKNNYVLLIGFVLIAIFSIYGQGESGYSVRDRGEDYLVDQGLSILGRNEFGMDYAHALRQLGLKSLTYKTEIERFKIAVEKFQTALLKENKLPAYKPIQVRSFLAVANCRLANAYETNSTNGVDYDLDIQIAYGACFAEYERVIKGTPTILTSVHIEKYVEMVIKSGNLELALDKIKEIRNLYKAKPVSVKNLLFFEGDVYYKQGNKKKASLAYDKWLRSKPDNFGVSDNIIDLVVIVKTL